ncbi:MAG: hypothetical protein A2512_07005 [Deltaproteobacteria bacterium RIFOXYD12_FULL_56_24]|nr:MAG: hypothetical protein A2512_07005 [Deltaproteobacteria bacterium RIFOXYD12_FULL_56_24]
MLDDGGIIPMPGKIEPHRANPEFASWVWALVEMDPTLLFDKAELVNITLPARLLRRIDTYAGAHHETRSGFLARAAMGAMQVGE